MKFTFSLALLLVVFTTLNAQQSLFDKAVRLDTLYDQIRAGDDALAEDVFSELRDLYPEGEDLTDDAIYKDVSGQNSYLAPKMNYVHNLLEDKRAVADTSIAMLNIRYDSLIREAVAVAVRFCPDHENYKESDCPFAISIGSINTNPQAKQVAYLRKSIKPGTGYDELVTALKDIENQLYEIDVQLDLLKRQGDAVLRLGGNDGGLGLPVGDGVDVSQGFAPLILQSGGGGSVQGALVDGASRWIAERMREELSIAFFDRFEIWMEEQQMASLFPSTVKALDITSVTDYSLMIQVLRAAFERDLEELPFNIGPFVRQELTDPAQIQAAEREADERYRTYRANTLKYAQLWEEDLMKAINFDGEVVDTSLAALNKQFSYLERTNRGINYVLFSIAAIRELSQGSHPANRCSLLNQRSDELFPHGGRIRPVLMLSDVLVRSFISVDQERGTTWLRRKDLARLSRDQQLREFYFGLIFHELRQNVRSRRNRLLAARKPYVDGLPYRNKVQWMTYGSPEEIEAMAAKLDQPELLRIERELFLLEQDERWLGKLVTDDPTEVGGLLSELSFFTERMDNLQQQYKELRTNGQAGIGNPQMVRLIRHSLSVLEPVFAMALEGEEAKLAQIQTLSEGILDAYTGVLEKDYDAVILSVVPVASSLLDIDYAEIKAIHQDDYQQKEFLFLQDQHGRRQRKLQEVFRYGAFLAAVAESRSPEDIKQAIRAIALPPGSYSIKRRSFGNISLNTYPGLTGGMELIRNEAGQKWAPNFGFTAPIGLAFSWGYRSDINNKKYLNTPKYRRRVDRSLDMRNDRYLNGHSGSLFFSLFDLGAVVLFRLDGNDNSLPEDVGFQQVFSPGVMYSHGFPNIPISVLAGVQMSPQLRKFGDAPADSYRFNLGITVDLPMANFHTRSVEREQK